MRDLSLAISPCPNDTFIFDALIHSRFPNNHFSVHPVFHDVEELNQLASQQAVDIIKISAAFYPQIQNEYEILSSGGAIGFGCGPLLVSRENLNPEELTSKKVAMPGERTTANLLLSLALPAVQNKTAVRFDLIEREILNSNFDAGVIIHENRFTYEKLGLKKILDLGEWWESKFNLPIPLGIIVVKRNLDTDLKKEIQKAIRQSVEFAFANREIVMPFVRRHTLAMEDDVMIRHIDTFVNAFSVDLSEPGRSALMKLFDEGCRLGWMPPVASDKIFVSE